MLHLLVFIQPELRFQREIWREGTVLTCNKRARSAVEGRLVQSAGPQERLLMVLLAEREHVRAVLTLRCGNKETCSTGVAPPQDPRREAGQSHMTTLLCYFLHSCIKKLQRKWTFCLFLL